MAKTPAQRQAEYRARRKHVGEDGNGERRLSLWVSTQTAVALEGLVHHHGVTKRKMIERLITAEDDKIISGLELDSPEWEA